MPKLEVDKRVAIVAALVIAGGLFLQTLPAPNPKPERPILKFLAKVAKLGLWIMVVQDDRPAGPPVYAASQRVYHVDEAGQRVLQNGEAW